MDNKAKAIELINQLSDENITKLYKFMQYSKLRQILGEQPMPDVAQNVLDYVDTFKDMRDNTLLMLDVFNYGKIYGIRQERARRSKNADRESLNAEIVSMIHELSDKP